MTSDNDPDEKRGPPPRGRRVSGSGRPKLTRKARILGGLAVFVTLLITGSSLAAYAAYLSTLHSIATFSTASIGTHQPPAYDSSENILVVGSDSRGGSNKKFGANIQGQRSDTMILLHIRPDHEGAVALSLPRDTEVPILACGPDGLGDPGQPAQPGATEMLNATFAYGGPPCLWKTIENQTGIRINHYVGLTFTGFEKIINDIGGVNVCLPEAIKDPKSGINLTAGKHHIGGAQALAFWRERYVGLGSDLQRIQREQYLMAGLIQEVKSGQLLSNYGKMFGTLRDAAKALTVDQGLSISDMVSLIEDLRSMSEKSVEFITAPNVPDPANANRVIWEQPQARMLFHAIAHDISIPKSARAPSPPSPPATTSPRNVQVDVENGSGQPGVAARAASELTSRGFKVVNTSNAANFNYTSDVIEYAASSDLPEVNTLKAQFGSSVQVREDTSLAPGTVYLILGSSFTGTLSTVSKSSSSSHSSSSASSSQSLGRSYGGINGSANICSDKKAFAGPDNPANGT
jgi:LCP family protein required for cell wall assembly